MAAAALAALGAPAAITVRLDNPVGNVSVVVAARKTIEVRRSSPTRAVHAEDASVERLPGLVSIKAHPPDGARIDIEAEIPYGFDVEARTVAGAISLRGLFRSAELRSETGDLLLSAPWSATRLRLTARQAPPQVSIAAGLPVKQETIRAGDGARHWLLRDRLPAWWITYGRIAADTGAPARVVLQDIPIPEDSPVKLPWQASGIVEEILAEKKSTAQPAAALTEQTAPPPSLAGEGMPVFRSSVRLVNLMAAVFDRQGRPVTDLAPADFEVLEDGVAQEVASAGSEEVPFNLALLLDLSGSTRRDRPAMKAAARQFLGIARPQDKVAAYALAHNLFHVLSPLTNERERLQAMVEAIPEVSGGTPLYDAIVLAYAEELRQRPLERNALIVLTDGIDNRIQGTGAPSQVPFEKLRNAAELMNALIYPVFLDPFTRVPPPRWARQAKENMQALADATGGRLFVAQSIDDLDPVYRLVGEELRSVYGLAYYPKNQQFDGRWREIRVRVKRPGVRVRTRQGYFAR